MDGVVVAVVCGAALVDDLMGLNTVVDVVSVVNAVVVGCVVDFGAVDADIVVNFEF